MASTPLSLTILRYAQDDKKDVTLSARPYRPVRAGSRNVATVSMKGEF